MMDNYCGGGGGGGGGHGRLQHEPLHNSGTTTPSPYHNYSLPKYGNQSCGVNGYGEMEWGKEAGGYSDGLGCLNPAPPPPLNDYYHAGQIPQIPNNERSGRLLPNYNSLTSYCNNKNNCVTAAAAAASGTVGIDTHALAHGQNPGNQLHQGNQSQNPQIQLHLHQHQSARHLIDKFNSDNNASSSPPLPSSLHRGIIKNESNSNNPAKPLPPYDCPALRGHLGDQSGVDDGGGAPEQVWSVTAWLHGRLPLLILLILLLLCLFLALSGALVYFRFLPPSGIRSHEPDEPCETTFCAFGATCRVENGRASCRCPEACSSDWAPTCGNDDVTYGNECLLRKFACQRQKTVRIKHPGACDEPDPCADKACLYGSRCVPSRDGHYATCECPTSCPNYGDSEDSLPVCGSDGKMHRNKCEMDRLACRLGRTITVKYNGKCDPCQDILCTAPQTCHLDEFSRNPTCRCGEVCATDFNPICGSDGKTYSNECIMRQEACLSRRELRVIYRGKCSSGVNPCESKTCNGYETCAINRFGIAQCICAMVCDPVIQPVCGTDRKTYDSECQLTLTSCRDSRKVGVAYRGTCESESLCAKHNCQGGATCTEKDGVAVCECPSCRADYDPVCGKQSDRILTFENECRLRLEACTTHSPIQLLYEGICNPCEKRHCDFYSVCVSESSGSKCICPKNCTSDMSTSTSVCGSDGVKYVNECDLRKSACQQQKMITVVEKQKCDMCVDVHCKFGAKCESGVCVCPAECPTERELVCGSNLVTYTNECELQKAACRLGRPLNVHFYGDCSEGIGPLAGGLDALGRKALGTPISKSPANSNPDFPPPKLCESISCDFDALCEVGGDGFPRCTCQFDCSLTPGSPVCASDLKLYKSECEMRREACHRQTELRPRPMELCEEVEVKPCNGEEPLKSNDTGEDINCSNRHSRTNCPTGSFCHRTPSFAKCCRKLPDRTTTTIPPPSSTKSLQAMCEGSIHGCCPDKATPALGPEYAGCPSICQCNKLGSVAETCDPVSQECLCRPGVGGARCDRCLPGFWGLSRIAIHLDSGCKPCGCSKFGSVREDCEQMTGRCVCKPGVLGHKCDSCSEGEFLGPYGCTVDPINLGRTCEEVECSFGAECEQDGNRAGCVCNIVCDDNTDVEEVCASDGFSYESSCLVRLQSCRGQKSIWVLHKGSCPDSSESYGTESPLRQWTGAGMYFTEPGDENMDIFGGAGKWGDGMAGIGSSGMKSTRHLPPQKTLREGNLQQKHLFSNRSPTLSTIQLKSHLGDSCQWSADCLTEHSVCVNGWCICREKFHEDPERVVCLPIVSHFEGSNACETAVCDEHTTCFDHRNGSHSCLCQLNPPVSEGSGNCAGTHHNNDSPTPFFSGKSTIVLGKLAGYHKLSLEIEITPYVDFAHSVIIFSSQHANGSGDFLSLALIDGYVEFRYDLGDGKTILRSSSRLAAGLTYRLAAKRYNRDGLLRVSEEEDVKGTSPGNMKSLNVDYGGFLGYVPLNSSRIWEAVGTSEGFIGCVHKLKVGRRRIEFIEDRDPLIISIHNVYQCMSSNSLPLGSTTPIYAHDEINEEIELEDNLQPSFKEDIIRQTNSLAQYSCSRNPCQNYGQCWGDKSSTSDSRCICHPEFTGKLCETRSRRVTETGAVLDFRGFSYLELPKIENGGRTNRIELWVMLRSPNAVILYNGQEVGKGDFVAIMVFNGHIQFIFDLGSGMANITWSTPTSLNKWHWIVASREGREGKLQVDGEIPQTVTSPPTLSELNVELPLYIGGVRDKSIIHRELFIRSSFDGALQHVRINNETYNKEIDEILKQKLVHRYEGPPCGSSVSPPCQNGGTCFPRLESFVCLCPSQFTGKTCETGKVISGPVRFDGENFIRFPRSVPKSDAPNASDYDDFYNENFDSQLDELFLVSDVAESYDNNGKQSEELSEPDYGSASRNEFTERKNFDARNRIEIVFRTSSDTSGVLIWTGKHFSTDNTNSGYLGLFLVNEYLELRVGIASVKPTTPVIIRSKVRVTDGRWHQVLIARRQQLVVLQIDGSTPQRATIEVGSNRYISDGQFWIGGVASSVLPNEVPPTYHQGFVGCVDLVRIEKRRLPLSKMATTTGIPLCEDDN